MKLDLITPNAVYDSVFGRPATIERDNDGSYLYRYNIAPKTENVPAMFGEAEGETEIQTGWQCCEVRLWEKPGKGVVKKAIIRSVMDESAEFAVVNAYNKHVLKVKVDTTAVDAYKKYLQFTEDLDAMLVADFKNYTE